MENKIKDFIKEGVHYCSVFNLEDSEEGLTFISSDDKNIQVGIWNYKKGKSLEAHYHNEFDRNATRTSESVYVVKGKIVSKVYDLDKNLICEVVLNKGELIVQYEGIHEYSILENALVLENKNGPYFGPDKDRTRVEIE